MRRIGEKTGRVLKYLETQNLAHIPPVSKKRGNWYRKRIKGQSGKVRYKKFYQNRKDIFNCLKKLSGIRIPKEINDILKLKTPLKVFRELYLPKFPNSLKTQFRSTKTDNITFNRKFLSHGDVVPRNIVFDENDFYLIDWEWVRLDKSRFDLSFFKAHVDHVAHHLNKDPIELDQNSQNNLAYLCGISDVFLDHFHPDHDHQIGLPKEEGEERFWRKKILKIKEKLDKQV